ncbi:hypothetical protein KC339_g118 [Hortaea werneckii]|nr:hypothetical protein KC339_g118 [Hortaea werneckii]
MAKSKIVASPFDCIQLLWKYTSLAADTLSIVGSKSPLGSRFFVRRQPVNHSVARAYFRWSGHFLGGRIFVVSILLAFMDISIVWFIVA